MKAIMLLLTSVLMVSCFFISCQSQVPATPLVEKPVMLTEAEIINLIGSEASVFTRHIEFEKMPLKPYSGKTWIGKGISYGCYREGQAPNKKGPSEEEILEDLNILSPYWNLIRVYGSDDDSQRLLKVIEENKLPFQVMLGVWLENETKHPERRLENLKQVGRAITLANRYPDLVAAINVGNESQVSWSWHRMEMDVLIRYIRAVRQYTDLPITTSDDYNFWNKAESKTVADEIDFISLHAYALWNGILLDHAIAWTDSVYQDIKFKHPDLDIILSETGWANIYNPENIGPGAQGTLMKAEVSLWAQQQFITDFWKWSENNQITTFLFEAFDEPWKGGGDQSGPNEVEKHWGVFNEDRTPKASFTNYLNQNN